MPEMPILAVAPIGLFRPTGLQGDQCSIIIFYGESMLFQYSTRSDRHANPLFEYSCCINNIFLCLPSTQIQFQSAIGNSFLVWANIFIVCPPFADKNGGQKSVAHMTESCLKANGQQSARTASRIR